MKNVGKPAKYKNTDDEAGYELDIMEKIAVMWGYLR